MKVKVAQLGLTVCDPMDYTVHGILQARILEWVAVPFSRGSSQHRDKTHVSHIAGGLGSSNTEASYAATIPKERFNNYTQIVFQNSKTPEKTRWLFSF